MRSFSKKLAFVLAAAMVVTSFAPAAKAEAAKEMAINKSSQILYVNEGINHKGADGVAAGKGNVSVYDFSVKNKPADWKDTLSFKWTTSDDEVVAVKAGGVATAVGVGKATITCKVTDKATKETVATLKTKVTVKANAYDVEITNADDVAGLAYEVGATVDLNRAMYDEDGNKTTKRGKLVTDYTRWIAEPSTGVTIDQKTGKFTFAEAGDYTLYCETYQSSKYDKVPTATSEKVKVTIADDSVELKQTTRDDVVLSFGQAVELTTADVTIKEIVPVVGGTDKVDYLVKSVTPSEDKKSYTVAVFYEFNDAAEYEVTVKGYDAQTFVASKGAPKTIVLHSTETNTSDRSVVVDKSTQIWATFYDANDIDITNAELRSKLTYTIKYADSEYENVDTFLYFAEVGERAVVTAEYHTWEYDDNGNEKNAMTSTPYTFYAVAKGEELITGITDYTTTGSYTSSDKKVVKMNDDRSLKVKIKTKDYPDNEVEISAFNEEIMNHGKTVTFGTAFFTSLTPDILEVYDDGTKVGLNPRKVGNARVMVSYKMNVNGVEVDTPIGIVNIDVKAAPTLDSVTLNNNSLVFCIDPADNTNSIAVENVEFILTIKDQYGNAYDNYELLNENGYVNGFKGLNTLSDRSLKSEVGTALEYATDCTKDGNPAVGIRIFNIADDEEINVFEDIMNDMDGNGKPDALSKTDGGDGKQETQATRFSYSFGIKDLTTKATKTVTFSVDARRAEDTINDKNISFVLDVGTTQWNGNNVARFSTPGDNSDASECAKIANFVVYQMTNGAKYDEVELLGKLPSDAELKRGVSDGYYYVINKNGSNVSDNAKKSDIGKDWSDTEGLPKQINYAFSSTKKSDIDTDRDIVNFASHEGAGTYEFIIYRVTDETKKSRVTSKSITVTADPGKYTLVSRDSVTAASEAQEDLIKCFTLKDTQGNTLSHKDDDITATTVKFGNNVRDYQVNLNYEKSEFTADGKTETLYVESITVWDNVDTWGKNADVEYTVPIGYFVKVK